MSFVLENMKHSAKTISKHAGLIFTTANIWFQIGHLSVFGKKREYLWQFGNGRLKVVFPVLSHFRVQFNCLNMQEAKSAGCVVNSAYLGDKWWFPFFKNDLKLEPSSLSKPKVKKFFYLGLRIHVNTWKSVFGNRHILQILDSSATPRSFEHLLSVYVVSCLGTSRSQQVSIYSEVQAVLLYVLLMYWRRNEKRRCRWLHHFRMVFVSVFLCIVLLVSNFADRSTQSQYFPHSSQRRILSGIHVSLTTP